MCPITFLYISKLHYSLGKLKGSERESFRLFKLKSTGKLPESMEWAYSSKFRTATFECKTSTEELLFISFSLKSSCILRSVDGCVWWGGQSQAGMQSHFQ
jgi:hypothetical protein